MVVVGEIRAKGNLPSAVNDPLQMPTSLQGCQS